MPTPRARDRRRAAGLAALLLLAPLAACHSWRVEPVPTTGAADRTLAGRVRATWTDGRRVELTRARLQRDTLHAEHYVIPRDGRPVVVTVPLDRVQGLERRRVNWWRTLGLSAGIYLGFGALGILVFHGGPSE